MAASPQTQTAAPGPRISLCMILKNEEKRLATALASARPWVDEIIVVDTGSTDRTVEIAQEFGAKVYHHPWEHNFAKHRNQSISYATGDWLLILDADEELDQETAPLIRQLVAQAPPEIKAFMFELYNAVAVGGQTFMLHARLFRNRVGFRYEGQVHNRPVIPGQVARTKVRLIHYGYNEDPATMEAKHQRRVEMIRKWVEQEPENFHSHSYLAHTLLARPETIPEAVQEAFTALDILRRSPGQEKHYPHVYYPLLAGLAMSEREDELLTQAADCLAVTPYYPDPLYFSSGVHYRRQDWASTREHCQHFIALQDECKDNPEKFVFFENLTYSHLNYVLFRWALAAAHLGLEQETMDLFGRLMRERDAQEASRQLVLHLMNAGHVELSLRLTLMAAQENPSWPWMAGAEQVLRQKLAEAETASLEEQALRLLGQGRWQEAETCMSQALQQGVVQAQSLLDLGQALDRQGQQDQARTWLMRGLNLHPGQAWAWKRLAEQSLGRGDRAGARALLARYTALEPGDEAAGARLAELAETQEGPTVAQQPPRLIVFLVGGVTPEMVRQVAPHFLMGRAWGELAGPDMRGLDLPSWATLYTGVDVQAHGLNRDLPRGSQPGLTDLPVPSFWELMPPEVRLGLMSVPMGCPPPSLPGWAVAGYPGGLLGPELVEPPSLAALVLAKGYRADLSRNQVEEYALPEQLAKDVRQEAILFQVERNKVTTAMAMPAVEVLAVGLSTLEYMQRAFDLAHAHTFFAYQQVYACIETLLAALQPEHFAVLSQRGYSTQNRQPQAGGFYCLSWLRGENGRSDPRAIAPEILKLMGGDSTRLGRRRSQS